MIRPLTYQFIVIYISMNVAAGASEILLPFPCDKNQKMIFMKKSLKIISMFVVAGMVMASCEGPMGPAGEDGAKGDKGDKGDPGTPGTTLACAECHNQSVVAPIMSEYEYSLHKTGEAFEEGTRTACAPCHSHEGFTFVVKNNTPATFVLNPTTSRYENQYFISNAAAALPTPINCMTCHSALHTTYGDEDFSPLTNVAAVPMTMYGGSKSINFERTKGNLCAKCHQPRPVTKSADGNVIDYALLVSSPGTTFNQMTPGYRTGVHYGTQAAMADGVGGIEFGTGYTNSVHASTSSCASCHMATASAFGGGHSFRIHTSAEDASTKTINFAGCNVGGCHTTMSATNTTFLAARTDIDTKLDQLAAKINALQAPNTADLLLKEDDGEYHGYFNIYDASSNPNGFYRNPSQGNVAFPTLTNAQFGAILNYQLVYRDGSKGVHNYPYMKNLLEKTLAAW